MFQPTSRYFYLRNKTSKLHFIYYKIIYNIKMKGTPKT